MPELPRNICVTQLEDGRWVSFEMSGPDAAHYYVQFNHNVRTLIEALAMTGSVANLYHDPAVYEWQVGREVFLEINYSKHKQEELNSV